MTDFGELAPWTLLGDHASLLAVGWLTAAAPFPTGTVTPAFYEKLLELCRDPWMPAVSAGFHQCEICQFDGPRMKDELYVPGDGVIYVAPVGIAHYVAAHAYRPPDVFIAAVHACPPMRSMQYKKAFLANGGRGFTPAPG